MAESVSASNSKPASHISFFSSFWNNVAHCTAISTSARNLKVESHFYNSSLFFPAHFVVAFEVFLYQIQGDLTITWQAQAPKTLSSLSTTPILSICVSWWWPRICVFCVFLILVLRRWPSWSGMWTRWPPSSVCSFSVVIKYTVFAYLFLYLYLYLYLLPRYVLPHVLRFRQPCMRPPVALEDSHVETTVQILSLVSWWKWLYS